MSHVRDQELAMMSQKIWGNFVRFSQVHNVPVKIARPLTIRTWLKINDGRVLPDFCSNIFKSGYVLLSDGSPRTFCYVSDAITGYFKILFSVEMEAYNIGVESPEISMLELAEKVIEIGSAYFDYGGKLFFLKSSEKEYLTDNPQRRCPVIEKAKKELGYKPKIDIDKGLLKSMYQIQKIINNMAKISIIGTGYADYCYAVFLKLAIMSHA